MGYGIIRRGGWEEEDGQPMFTALIEFPDGPPDHLTAAMVWNATPVRIVEATDAPRSGSEMDERPGKVEHTHMVK